MQTITFTCETITPMFLSGADGTSPELRAPSIKGALRFWWRAMNGHRFENVEEMKAEEGKIFGDTANRSKVNICCYFDNINYFNFIENGASFTKKEQYFVYPFYHHAKERKGMNGNFTVSFSSNDIECLAIFIQNFWILSCLGGLGSRSRRGLGSFRIISSIFLGFDDLDTSENNIKNKIIKLSKIFTKSLDIKNFTEIGDIFKLSNKTKLNIISNKIKLRFLKSYSNTYNTSIIYKQEGNSWNNCLGSIADAMMKIRDAFSYKSLKFKQSDLNKKAAFGLPINVMSSDLMVNLVLEDKILKRSSPIFITIKKIDTKYYWIVLHMKGEFMPNDAMIEFGDKVWTSDNLDDSLLSSFIDSINNNNSINL
jgi:CRISPR-associated protein Cmr1